MKMESRYVHITKGIFENCQFFFYDRSRCAGFSSKIITTCVYQQPSKSRYAPNVYWHFATLALSSFAFEPIETYVENPYM